MGGGFGMAVGAQTIEANTVRDGEQCGAACRIGHLRSLQLAFLNGTRLGQPCALPLC